MAQPKKLSELTNISSTATDSLVYVADKSGAAYSGRQITVADLLQSYSTTTQVNALITAAVDGIVDGAPGALNTLNEIAAALNDDASIANTLLAAINANETHIDNMATLTGVAKDEVDMGTFSGVTIADSSTVKEALQALETSVESKGSSASLTALTTAVGDLNTLTGVAQNAETLGAFTGATINDNETVKDALQALETAIENVDIVYEDDNVNRLVGNTTADACPASYYFLVVDTVTGDIKAVEKSFMEID